jgi:hypothetical protein
MSKGASQLEIQTALNDLDAWKAPSVPSAVGARNGSQRVQPSPDSARRSQNLLAGQGLPV